MARRSLYDPLLATTKTTQIPQRHKYEVHRRENDFVIVTRHHSAIDAALQQRREGGSIVKV